MSQTASTPSTTLESHPDVTRPCGVVDWCVMPAALSGFTLTDDEGHDVRQHDAGTTLLTTDADLPQVSVAMTRDELRDPRTGAVSWEAPQLMLVVARPGEDGERATLSLGDAQQVVAGLQAAILRAQTVAVSGRTSESQPEGDDLATQAPEVLRDAPGGRPATTPSPVMAVLAAAPAPSLPCPSWCPLPAGHGWTDAETYGAGDVSRTHELDLSPVGPDGYALVALSRHDRLWLVSGEEHVIGASRVGVEVQADDGSANLTAAQSLELAGTLLRATRLLQAGHRTGDPETGLADEEWAWRVRAGLVDAGDAALALSVAVGGVDGQHLPAVLAAARRAAVRVLRRAAWARYA